MPDGAAKSFFISHVTTEAPIASLIGRWLHAAGATPFVASQDISAGDLWLQSLKQTLAKADVVLVLASRRSMDRKWVWFEAGSAWASTRRRCIPVCFEDGFGKNALPEPLASLQAIDIATDSGMIAMAELAGQSCSPDEVRVRRRALEAAILESNRINPRTDRTLPPPPSPGVLVDASHAQDGWPRHHLLPNLLKDTSDLKSSIGVEEAITVRWVEHPEQFWRYDLAAWRGMIMALPNHTMLAAAVVDELEAWVKAGGRLLLLGFELGDRHHRANLNALADVFGIRFNTDIVASTSTFTGKPYDAPIDIDLTTATGSLVSGLSSIRVWNAQSVSVEPGGVPLIPLTGLGLAQLTNESAHYDDDGWQTGGNQHFLTTTAPRDRYLAAFAPPELCGRGSVLALGTWDLRLSDASSDTAAFVRRLVGWLAGQ
jgi:hypothetical protein